MLTGSSANEMHCQLNPIPPLPPIFWLHWWSTALAWSLLRELQGTALRQLIVGHAVYWQGGCKACIR